MTRKGKSFEESDEEKIIEYIDSNYLSIDSLTEVAEVSAVCGYHDYKYFSRVFKSEVGVSPSQFRSG